MSLISGNEKIFAKGVIGNVRKAQEDSHGWKLGTPNGDLFVVCDGMGGHVGGAMASQTAVNCIVEYIEKEKYATPVEALNGALQYANMQILGYANDHPEYKGMGTTACIVLMQDDGVWIAHVGDSRIYLFLGKERKLHRITKDHSYVQTLVDAGQITDEMAEHHPNKNRIMKALGIKPELQPSFNSEGKPIHPKNGDIFLICSDGLSGMIPDRTIERVLGEKTSLEEKGEELINHAMVGETVQPGGQDNCTMELIEVDQSIWETSEFKSYNPEAATVRRISIKDDKAEMTRRLSMACTSTQKQTKDIESKVDKKKTLKILVAVAVVVLLVLGGLFKPINKHRISRLIDDTVQSRKLVDSLEKKDSTYAVNIQDISGQTFATPEPDDLRLIEQYKQLQEKNGKELKNAREEHEKNVIKLKKQEKVKKIVNRKKQ